MGECGWIFYIQNCKDGDYLMKQHVRQDSYLFDGLQEQSAEENILI
jgi:hypothetical protein